MPTHRSIPERYPVIEHMEERLRASGRQLPEPGRWQARRSGLLGLVIGCAGGAGIVAVFLAVIQNTP